MDDSDLPDRFSLHNLFCQFDRECDTRSRLGFSPLLCLPHLRFLYHRSLQLLDIAYTRGLSPLSSTRIRFRYCRRLGNLWKRAIPVAAFASPARNALAGLRGTHFIFYLPGDAPFLG